MNSCDLHLFSSASSRENTTYTDSQLRNVLGPSCRLIRMYKVSPDMITHVFNLFYYYLLSLILCVFHTSAPGSSGMLHYGSALHYRSSKCTAITFFKQGLCLFSRWKGVWIIESAAEGEARRSEQGKEMNVCIPFLSRMRLWCCLTVGTVS